MYNEKYKMYNGIGNAFHDVNIGRGDSQNAYIY